LEIRQLKTFQTVATLLSFTRASRQLHYAQSSVSAQIQTLEEELGVKLFDRLGKRVLLTEAGERLRQYAQKILDLEEETRVEVAGMNAPQGALNIRIPETLGEYRLPPAIKRFHEQYPAVRLRFITCSHDGLQEDLRKGVTDLAFLLTESIHSADLNVEALGFETIVLAAPCHHPLRRRPRVRTADLQGETILFSRVDCSYMKSFLLMAQAAQIHFSAMIEFNSVAILKRCVKEGIGIALLPRIAVAHDIAKGQVAALKWEDAFEVAILMTWYKERWISPTLNAFIESTRTAFSR